PSDLAPTSPRRRTFDSVTRSGPGGVAAATDSGSFSAQGVSRSMIDVRDFVVMKLLRITTWTGPRGARQHHADAEILELEYRFNYRSITQRRQRGVRRKRETNGDRGTHCRRHRGRIRNRGGTGQGPA